MNMNWNPLESEWYSFTPRGGWNPCISEQEKIKAIHLFFFFTRQKGYPEMQAESMVQMYLWKQKYPSMKYSEEQEKKLVFALKPIIH